MTRPRSAPLAVVVGAEPEATAERLRIATDLRGEGLAIGVDLVPRKLGRQLEAAVKAGARFAVIVGDELADGNIVLRDLGAASQKPVAAGRPAGHCSGGSRARATDHRLARSCRSRTIRRP